MQTMTMVPDDHPLDEHAADERDDERGDECDPVGQAGVEHGPREIGTEHRDLALGEVHDVGGLIDHHERQRDAAVDAARREPRDDLLEEGLHAQYPR